MPSLLKPIFAGCTILGWQGFFFELFKNTVPLSSASHDFWWEIVHVQLIIPLHVKCCFPQDAFSILPISLSSAVWLWCVSVYFHQLYPARGLLTYWTCQFMSFTNLGDHMAIVCSNISFCLIPSLFSWDANYYILHIFRLSHRFLRLTFFFFSQCFSLFFKLGNYYYSMLKCTELENMRKI